MFARRLGFIFVICALTVSTAVAQDRNAASKTGSGYPSDLADSDKQTLQKVVDLLRANNTADANKVWTLFVLKYFAAPEKRNGILLLADAVARDVVMNTPDRSQKQVPTTKDPRAANQKQAPKSITLKQAYDEVAKYATELKTILSAPVKGGVAVVSRLEVTFNAAGDPVVRRLPAEKLDAGSLKAELANAEALLKKLNFEIAAADLDERKAQQKDQQDEATIAGLRNMLNEWAQIALLKSKSK